MSKISKFAVLLSAKLALAGFIFAQAGSATPHSTAPEFQHGQPQVLTSSEEAQDHTAPVLWIESVEVIRSNHGPQLDMIRVRGLAATEGWESAQLVPLTKGLPADGILDLAMVAEAPQDNSTPTAYPEIEAVFTIEEGHPFKGVRVHGASNRVVLHSLPGYAESATPPKNCANCQGKLFVPKGKTAPATASVVHEEDLPHNLRVIRADEGIGSLESNPNRLTLLLDENDQIEMATWD